MYFQLTSDKMELGLGFADGDLREDKREVKQCLSSYNAKICHPKVMHAE